LAEFTLTGTDYYDISIINGINMGISMAPDRTNAQLSATDPYVCGTPGAKTQAVTTPQYLKACPWTIDLNVPGMGDQTNLLRQVKPNVEAGVTIYPTCPCTAPYVCGLALNVLNTKQGKFVQTCGTDVKTYWTADQICGTLPPGGGPVNNLYPLPCVTNGSSSENATLTYMTSLLECTGEKGFSCYQGSTAPQCRTGAGCGCPTLEANNLWPLPGPTVTNNCTGTNADWTQYIQPWLVGLKAACPTAYTFPYDDVTSTFTCRAAAGFAGGAPGYTVTLFDTK
jgi:hypothetical protein